MESSLHMVFPNSGQNLRDKGNIISPQIGEIDSDRGSPINLDWERVR